MDLGGLVDLVGLLSAHSPHVKYARCVGLEGGIVQRLHEDGNPVLTLLPILHTSSRNASTASASATKARNTDSPYRYLPCAGSADGEIAKDRSGRQREVIARDDGRLHSAIICQVLSKVAAQFFSESVYVWGRVSTQTIANRCGFNPGRICLP